MKMRKLICMGMILAMSLSVLNGCGSEPEKMEKTEEKEESSKSDEKINLEFWDMTWGPAEYISTAEGLVQKFNDSQDEIEVTYQSIPWDNFTRPLQLPLHLNLRPMFLPAQDISSISLP